MSNLTGLVLAVQTVFSYHIPYCAAKQSENANETKNIDLFFTERNEVKKHLRIRRSCLYFTAVFMESGGKSQSAELWIKFTKSSQTLDNTFKIIFYDEIVLQKGQQIT